MHMKYKVFFYKLKTQENLGIFLTLQILQEQ